MIYESICRKCSEKFVYSRPVDKRDETPICCGHKTERVFSPTPGKVDTPAYRR